MRRAAIAVSISVLVGALAFARTAFCGGGPEGDEEQEARGARARRTWLREGVGAAPRVVEALGSGDAWLEDEARRVLLRWGPRSVSPLLDWLARDRHANRGKTIERDAPEQTLSQVLCTAGLRWSNDDDDLAPAPVQQRPTERAHASAALRTALAPIMTALRNRKGPRARAAWHAVRDMVTQDNCPNRQRAFEMTGDAVAALIDVQPADEKSDFLLGLSAFGPAARSAVPAAVALLEDQRFVAEAIQLLGDIGPASAPAVPKLRSLLGGEQRVSAALALGQIGPAARATLPDLISLLKAADRSGCDKSPPLRALAVPVGLLGATGEREAAQAVEALVESLRACPRNAESIVTGLGSLGARGRTAEPALLTVVRDGTSPLTIRLLAAHSLDTIGAPLSADDQALLSKLEGELHRQNTPAPYVGNQL